MLAVVLTVMLQQAATGQVVWAPPPPPPAEAEAPADIHAIPDYARADPFAYERAECSPLMRKADERLEACQQRVRVALAANLGADLPPGLAPTGAPDECRQAAAGDRYALQCGAPDRATGAVVRPLEQACETRPRARPGGGVVWTEECRPADGRAPTQDGLRVRLGGTD